MADPRAAEIARLEQSIAVLEEQQRALGIDLSLPLQLQRERLAQLVQTAPAVTSGQSGGINAEQLTTAGDAVGRDKVTSHTETITATDSSVVVKDSDVRGDIRINFAGDDPVANQALLARYLKWVVKDCAPLKLTGIDQGAAHPGQQPPGLTSVYVDLNLDLKIPADSQFTDSFQRVAEQPRGKRTEPEMEAREARVVSALEALAYCPTMVLLGKPGSGKSTLSTYLALNLAEAGLGDDAALHHLGEDWSHGSLLPVRVILRQFAASLLADVQHGEAAHLWQFIKSEIVRCGLPDKASELVQDVAAKSGALFLLDGLDEVGDEQRRAIVLEAVTKFMHTAGDQCRFLITARPYAWEDGEQRLANVERVYRLADFELDQIDLFITRWYEAIAALGWIDDHTASEKTQELQAAVQRVDLLALASNPLLLTLMATLHSNRARLPDDRADLYNEVVDLLLERWNKPSGADRGLIDALAIPTLTLANLREPIEQLAFDAHVEHRGKPGTADLAEMALLGAFRPLLGGKLDKALLVIDYIEKRAGLLIGQGVRQQQRQFTFPHRTFQEYLAASYLAAQNDFSERSTNLVQDAPAHWREVVILAARKAGKERGLAAADALIHGQSCDDYRRKGNVLHENDWQAAILAGAQVLEIGLAVVESRDVYRAVRDRVANWLLRLIETSGTLTLPERIEAGNTLGRLGDPRFEVQHAADGTAFILPIPLCIKAGPFEMGSNKDETPYNDEYSKATKNKCHIVEVAEFLISPYPVTNAEYFCFVKAAHAQAPEHWRSSEVPPGLQNHPVVYVSWHDARAYCEWLSQASGRNVRLPTEAEWEKAARWDQPQKHSRVYPWGDEWDSAKCNTDESGIGATTPVGLYPDGVSPAGLFDAAGNVWEWTSTINLEYPYRSDDKHEKIDQGSARVLRGGSWCAPVEAARVVRPAAPPPAYRRDYYGFRCCFSPGSRR